MPESNSKRQHPSRKSLLAFLRMITDWSEAVRFRLVLLLVFLGAVAFLLAARSSTQTPLQLKLRQDMSINVPSNWKVGIQDADSVRLYVGLKKEPAELSSNLRVPQNPKPEIVIAAEAGMTITFEQRRDHAEAVRRLAEIASEYAAPFETLVIADWPAIERRYRAPLPQPGEQDRFAGKIETWFSTTAVAAGDTIIRIDTMLAPQADMALLQQAVSIGRSLRVPGGNHAASQSELDQIRKLAKPPRTSSSASTEATKSKVVPGDRRSPGAAVQVQSGVGELEVTSNDGTHVVVAANSGYSFSSNSGGTYTFGGGTPCNQARCDGDPSLSVGNSGNIYYAWIGGPANNRLGDGVSQSTNNGQTFAFRGMAVSCPGTPGCSVADQEHIAADRKNAGSGGDRIYNAWRDFASSFSIRITCSSDSGSTWPTTRTITSGGDFPRVAVGGDGFVYVAYAAGGNMMVDKFDNCDLGLNHQTGFPTMVSSFTNVPCPVAGLDRCNNGNLLSSPKVAVDDLDPAHVYYSFATSTGGGNENVMVFDSINGGASFARSVQVNSSVTGRRYMPWLATYGGMALVSWYDRRTATTGNNDRTRFYIGGATVRGPNLVALPETDLSGNDDSQCSTWPCSPRATADSESCSTQPELAGICVNGMGAGSFTRCDFSSTTCPTGETCQTSGGCPKYGDYNGNAAALGRHFSAWASALPPVTVGGASGAIKVYASADRIPSDFYVRDWNNAPTLFDNGAQPSTQWDFWARSDVWNQNTNVAASPGPDGSVLGDPPSRSGSNFVYARVSRRAAAMSTAPTANVTVNFLMGDYGLGVPFAPIGSEMVTFGPGDMTKITPAHAWSVPSGASNHLCIAVEIVGPDGDTFVPPSIAGTAVGPADPMIIIDNDKAQRNLQDTVGTGAGTELIAEVRNQQAKRRLMDLRIRMPRDARVKAFVDTIGGSRTELTNDGRIVVGELAPGETRWLRFHFTTLEGVDKPTPVAIFEDTDPPSNGFTILLRRDSIKVVGPRDLIAAADVFTRVAIVESNGSAKELAALALRSAREVTTDSYVNYFSRNQPAIRAVVLAHLRRAQGNDPFDLNGAVKDLAQAIDRKDANSISVAQTEIVERLDAHLTMLMRAKQFVR